MTMRDPKDWSTDMTEEQFHKLCEDAYAGLEISPKTAEKMQWMWHCRTCKEIVYGNTCRGCGSYITVPGGGGE